MSQTSAFHTFGTRETLQTDAAHWVQTRLKDALARRGTASLICSGGSTPGPIYRELSGCDLDWQNVTVGLTDERWVNPEHEASNARLVRETLLQDKAADATFVAMKTSAETPFGAEPALNEAYRPLTQAADVMMLGMGSDGHTLSWFSDAKGLDAAIDPANPLDVAAIDAPKSDVTGNQTLRMTLTSPVIARARYILLIITGDKKRAVYERNDKTNPVTLMRKAAGDALTIFYSA